MKKLNLNILNNLNNEDKQKLLNIGIEPNQEERAGTFAMVDNEITDVQLDEGKVEILPLKKAFEKYSWLKDYSWKIISPEKDQYTKETAEADANGYFIWAKKGYKSDLPLQACFYIKSTRFKQTVHNIIIVDEDAELHIINGCASANYVNEGAHLGITEMYIKKNGFLSYTMIHDWGENIIVRPRSAIQVEEKGIFISNYVSMKTVHSTQSSPIVYLKGKKSKAQLYSILYAPENTNLDIGGKIFLQAPETSAEIISRAVSNGGNIISPVELLAEVDNVKGHMECSGIMLKSGGMVYAIPALKGISGNIDLSHEAAVGKIAQEEIEYLMARGLSEDEAISLIIKGFLDIKIKGLPEFLQKSIDETINLSLKGI